MIRCCSLFEGFIITLMVGAGSLITIVLKWADQLPSLNSIGKNVPFSHPFLQSTFMFLGELFCIALFYVQRCWRKKHKNVELNKGKDMNVYLYKFWRYQHSYFILIFYSYRKVCTKHREQFGKWVSSNWWHEKDIPG